MISSEIAEQEMVWRTFSSDCELRGPLKDHPVVVVDVCALRALRKQTLTHLLHHQQHFFN